MSSLDPFGPKTKLVMAYRKAAMACAALHQGLPNSFAEAVLNDQLDQRLVEMAPARQILRQKNFEVYVQTLAREAVVRYAGSAGERLADDPESALLPRRVWVDQGLFTQADDQQVLLRLEQMMQPFFCVEPGEPEADLLAALMQGFCALYSSVAFRLVTGPLNPIILEAVEEMIQGREVSVEWIHSRLEGLSQVEAG